jgi:hypothetical protein
MIHRGFSASNIESKLSYHTKNLSPWVVAFATYAYQSLGQNWPKNVQEWTLFALGSIVFVYGFIQNYSSASKIAQ